MSIKNSILLLTTFLFCFGFVKSSPGEKGNRKKNDVNIENSNYKANNGCITPKKCRHGLNLCAWCCKRSTRNQQLGGSGSGDDTKLSTCQLLP